MTGTYATRRQLVLIFALTAVLSGASVLLAYEDWLGSRGETGRAMEDSTILTFPATAAMSAWIASEPKRRRFEWMMETSSRTRYSAFLRQTLVLSVAASMAVLLVGLAALIATATQANFGAPPFLTLIPVVAGQFTMVGLGVVVASILPPLISPVAALVSVYAVLVLADTGKPSLAPLSGLLVSDSRERTYRATLEWMLGLRGVWLLALCLVLVAIAARADWKWLLPFAVACMTAVPLLLVGDAGMKIDRAATIPVCHRPDARVELCLSAARDHTYDSVWKSVRPVTLSLEGLAPNGWKFVEEGTSGLVGVGIRAGSVSVPFGVVNGVNGNAHVVDRGQLQADLSTRILQGNCRPVGVGPDGRAPDATPQDVIQEWLLTGLGIAVDDSGGINAPQLSSGALNYAPVEGFRSSWTGAHQDQRAAWFERHGEALVGCRLKAADLDLP